MGKPTPQPLVWLLLAVVSLAILTLNCQLHARIDALRENVHDLRVQVRAHIGKYGER